MAQQVHQVVGIGNARPFDRRTVLRLAIWGAAAAATLSIAVLAGYSNPATLRPLGTIAEALGQTQRRVEASPAQTMTRSTEADNETRQLAEILRMLATDRNELLARIRSIEQSLDDITGSITRQATAASLPPTPSPATDASVRASAPVTPSAAVETVSPMPSPPPDQVAAVADELPPTPNWVATLPAFGGSAEADLFMHRIGFKSELIAEYGVDIGAAVNFDGLRVLWNSTRAGQAALLNGLSPHVVLRENSKSRAVELRLIVGPLPDAEAATRLCASLSAARRFCQPTPFVGQNFALSSPERRSAGPCWRRPANPLLNQRASRREQLLELKKSLTRNCRGSAATA